MINNKHISKIIIAIMSVAVILCILAVTFSDKLEDILGDRTVKMEYETELFDTDEIISINIDMDEEEWTKMLENATSEEYYVCDVTVNGKTFKNVAIRPKGNTSLSSIAMNPDTDRYSFKLEFDHFVEGQTCWGLDKLILNNDYADATNMKEAIVYDMFNYIGADASLYNYAKVSLNGEYWGVYLALEAVEKSFMLRNFGTQDGELYKPDSMEIGGGNKDSSSGGGPGGFPGGEKPEGMPDFDPENMPDMGDFKPGEMPDFGDFDPSNMPTPPDFEADGSNEAAGDSDSNRPGGGGGPSMGGKGANLNYTDDDLDSYETIWEGEITDTSKGDHRRVVTALKNISEGTDLEKYLDIDNILKYMAVHAFAVNMDSLSGNMAHNYYLYEYNGQLNMFPWDYNLSFGGMSAGKSEGADDMINDAIDTPFDGTDFFDALLENEEYLEIYHGYLRQLAEEYVEGGRFEEVYSRIRNQIDELVETDPTAFYSGDEYEAAAEMLHETILLRAESVIGQLNGTIPSTDEGQKADSSSLIDASEIDISTMGTFNMGGVKEGEEGKRRGGRTKAGGAPGNGMRPSFEGMPGQASTVNLSKNIIFLGACMGLALIVLFVIKKRVRIRW
ncbi:MAG: CotH kinase family protein [Lachnospiraceae bacterium]|nr:CotH kinase family protein [Lachnospiraceae bacterium]